MNKVNVLSLALSLLSISLFSCSTQENNREIIVNFDFDEIKKIIVIQKQ